MRTFFAFLLVAAVLCFNGCSSDEEDSQNAAYQPFTGKWDVKETNGAHSEEYELMIGASYGADSSIFLYNLDNFGYASGATAKIIKKDSFVIPFQNLRGYNISGSGYLTADNDSLYFQWNGGPHGNCTAVGTLTDQ